MCEKWTPHYPLDEIKRLVGTGCFIRTQRVERYMSSKGWSERVVQQVVSSLTVDSFHKSQQHRDRSGQWLDIYRPWQDGKRMYVKYTVAATGSVVVMSFCRDGEAH